MAGASGAARRVGGVGEASEEGSVERGALFELFAEVSSEFIFDCRG